MKTKAKEKVLLLALGDDYWTPFVFEMADALNHKGIETIIVTDSRAGEYQVFGGKKDAPCKIYYFSDFHDENRDIALKRPDIVRVDALFSDYYRLFVYGAHKKLRSIPWGYLRISLHAFFEDIFDRENIGVVLHDQVSTSFSYVCYLVANSYGVDYFGLVGARIPERYEVRKTIYEEDQVVESIYQDIVTGKHPLTTDEMKWAKNYLDSIDEQQPSYMKGNFLNDVRFSAYVNIGKLTSVLRKIKYTFAERSEFSLCSFREPPLRAALRSFFRNMLRLARKKGFAKYDSNIEVDWIDKNRYWVYPVHFQPEASTSVGSPHFVDQLNLIRNIAFSLPNNTYLVVKEHVSAIGFHDKHFYRNLSELPNVRLVSPEWNIKQLIRQSQGVITLTSTAAFEALLLGKHVYMFGDAFYQFHPRCKKVDSWRGLQDEFEKKQQDIEDSLDVEFLVSYKRYTRSGTLSYAKKGWGISDDLISLLKQALVERAKKR